MLHFFIISGIRASGGHIKEISKTNIIRERDFRPDRVGFGCTSRSGPARLYIQAQKYGVNPGGILYDKDARGTLQMTKGTPPQFANQFTKVRFFGIEVHANTKY